MNKAQVVSGGENEEGRKEGRNGPMSSLPMCAPSSAIEEEDATMDD